MSIHEICSKSLAVVLVVSLLSFPQTGCSSTVNVVAEQASRADDIYKTTEVALFWGLMDRVHGVDCDGHGFQIVSVKTNWFYSLCTVVTWGAVVPLTVEYRCTSPSPEDGGVIGELKEKSE